MSLCAHAPGDTIVVEERWHGLLWSAVPHHVVESGPDHLTRDERKKYTLRARRARVAEVPEAPNKLFFYRQGRWSRTNLGWSWKDRDDYRELLADGTLDAAIIEAETDEVLQEMDSHRGPFAPHWPQFSPDPHWLTPVLPQSHAVHGSGWSFPALR